MNSIIVHRVREAVEKIRYEAQHRRETTPSDVAAEAFEHAANEVDRALADALRETERLTPEQYGELHNVTPQTVTRWIRLGELEAERSATGYLIPRDARRTERKKA